MAKEYTEEQLFNLSDEELESAVNELRAEPDVSDNDEEEEIPTQGDDDGEVQTEEEINNDDDDDDDDGDSEEVEIVEEVIETPSTYKVKANGQEYDFNIDELIKLAPKALDYTKKTQYLAPYRKTISAIEENGISQEDINLLIDMKKGDKNAIAQFLQNSEIDTFDLPDSSEINYTPNDYGQDANQSELMEIVNTLKQDEDGFNKVNNALTMFDEKSKAMMYSQPHLLLGLDGDIKTGTYNKVMPEATKAAALDGYRRPLVEYYVTVGQRLLQEEQNKTVQEAKLKEETTKVINRNKKKAQIPSTNTNTEVRKDIESASDINNDDFWKWRKSLDS